MMLMLINVPLFNKWMGGAAARLTRLVAMRLLDTSSGGSSFSSSLGSKLLTRGLATSGLACDVV
jgi:hypothetical protein